MARLILLTDFSEEYAKLLLKGIVEYSKTHTPWVMCKMPLSYREVNGMKGVLDWALNWKADAIIGQFYPHEEVEIFAEHGIIAIAQDFKSRFSSIPNITGDHYQAGKMGAEYFINKGYKNFAFYGFKDVVWSDERSEGFKETIRAATHSAHYSEYINASQKDLWYYDSENLINWILHLPKPVALMACDDNQAHHIAEICNHHSIKIPEEVAILGVDNDEAVCSLASPPLSSIHQAVEKGGYDVAQLIDEHLQDNSIPLRNVIVEPTHIVSRQSTNIYATKDKDITVVLKHIHNHIEDKLSVSELQRLVPLSRRLLEIKFKKVTGSSIYAYITNLRMKQFANQLLNSSEPIANIAMSLGFSESKNVSRQFKQIKGCTPSEYRARNAVKTKYS